MKSFKGTLLLLAVFLAIGSYAYFVEFKGTEKKEELKAQNSKLFLNIKSEDINRIILTWAASRAVLVKQDNAWHLTDTVQDLADPVAVETLLTAIKEESSEQVVKEGDGLDLKKFGLADPVGSVEVLTNTGTGAKIEFGSVDGIGGIKYLYLPNQKKIVTVGGFTQTKFQKTARDLREKKILALQPIDIVRLDIQGPVSAKLQKKNAVWTYEGMEKATVDPSKVNNYLQELANLRASEVVAELKTEKDAVSKFGLRATTLRVTATKADGSLLKLFVHSGKEGKSYLTQESRPQVFEVPTSVADSLKIKDSQFRDTKAPFKFDAAQVHHVEIRSPISKLVFKKVNGIWESLNSDAKTAGKKPSPAKIQGLLQALSGLEVAEFSKAVKGQVVGSVELKDQEQKTVFRLDYGRDQGKDLRIVTTSAGSDVLLVNRPAVTSLPLQDLFEEAPKEAGEIQVKETQ